MGAHVELKGVAMDPVLDKARGAQNFLERLVAKIPGFGGYQEKDLRRDADRLQREYLAARLEETKKGLNDLANGATRAGALDLINDIETARKRLDKVIARIRFAERGYAGFFDTLKVDEALLARVYQFDLSLIEEVEAIRAGIAAAGAAPANLAGALRDLIAKVDAADGRLNEREAILSGAK
jgi:hypothetical protein